MSFAFGTTVVGSDYHLTWTDWTVQGHFVDKMDKMGQNYKWSGFHENGNMINVSKNSESIKKKFVPNIALLKSMKASGLSEQSLSGKSGVSLKSIRRYLDGSNPGRTNSLLVATALGVTVFDLWPHLDPVKVTEDSVTTEDITKVYTDRSDFKRNFPAFDLLANSLFIQAIGISLNFICQDITDKQIIQLINQGVKMQCLFLDPYGKYIGEREREEGHEPKTLVNITETNIATLRRVKRRLSSELKDAISIKIYDETVRFNLIFIDESICIHQAYLPHLRGIETPVMVMEKQSDTEGLFPIYHGMFEQIWERAKDWNHD